MKSEKDFIELKTKQINMTSQIDKRQSAGDQLAHYSELKRKDEELTKERIIQERIRLTIKENEEKTGGNLHAKYIQALHTLNIESNIKVINELLDLDNYALRAKLGEWRKNQIEELSNIEKTVRKIINLDYK